MCVCECLYACVCLCVCVFIMYAGVWISCVYMCSGCVFECLLCVHVYLCVCMCVCVCMSMCVDLHIIVCVPAPSYLSDTGYPRLSCSIPCLARIQSFPWEALVLFLERSIRKRDPVTSCVTVLLLGLSADKERKACVYPMGNTAPPLCFCIKLNTNSLLQFPPITPGSSHPCLLPYSEQR